jgi:hypothetical protein
MGWLAKCSWRSSIESVSPLAPSPRHSNVSPGECLGNGPSPTSLPRSHTEHTSGNHNTPAIIVASNYASLCDPLPQSVCSAARPKAILVSTPTRFTLRERRRHRLDLLISTLHAGLHDIFPRHHWARRLGRHATRHSRSLYAGNSFPPIFSHSVLFLGIRQQPQSFAHPHPHGVHSGPSPLIPPIAFHPPSSIPPSPPPLPSLTSLQATSDIKLNGTLIIPTPLFDVLDGQVCIACLLVSIAAARSSHGSEHR